LAAPSSPSLGLFAAPRDVLGAARLPPGVGLRAALVTAVYAITLRSCCAVSMLHRKEATNLSYTMACILPYYPNECCAMIAILLPTTLLPPYHPNDIHSAPVPVYNPPMGCCCDNCMAWHPVQSALRKQPALTSTGRFQTVSGQVFLPCSLNRGTLYTGLLVRASCLILQMPGTGLSGT
jgi:hypothetical protein